MMNRRSTIAVALALFGAWALAAGEAPGADDHTHGRRRAAEGRECSVECADKMSAVSQHLEQAVKALEAGEKASALAHLKAAQGTVRDMHHTCSACMDRGKHAAAATSAAKEYANTHCPIMGGKIDPAKVTPKLTREWQGKKVAFCCSPCIDKWEKMSDEEKKAALEKASPKPTASPAPAAGEKKGCPSGGGCCPKR